MASYARPRHRRSDDSTANTSATVGPDVVRRLEALPEVAHAYGVVTSSGLNLLDKTGHLVGGTGAPTITFNYTGERNLLGKPMLELTNGKFPTQAGEISLDDSTAKRAGYRVGDRVTMISPVGKPRRYATLVGTAQFYGGGTAGASLVVMSTQGAQDILLEGKDRFQSVDLTAAPGVSQKQMVAAARTVIPQGYSAVTGDKVVSESKSAVGKFLNVIGTFLTVFAVIAVLVGGFIIVNTFSILIAQRIRDLALLRAMGASRRQVSRSVLIEAFVMSLIACVLGILLGWGLALGLAAVFRASGLDVSSSDLVLTPRTIIVSFVVGIVVTLVAAYLPARRAGRVPPVAAMREDALAKPGSLRRRTVIGAVLLAIGAGFALIGVRGGPGSDALWVGIAAGIWVLTFAAIAPAVGRPVLAACRSVFGRLFGSTGRLAGENALRDPRRSGATAAALMIGLALVAMISVLAASMNASVTKIVNDQFTSDFIVSGSNFQPFPVAVADRVGKVPGVGVMAQQRYTAALIDKQPTSLLAIDQNFGKIFKLSMISGTQEVHGDEVILSKRAATKYDVKVGGKLPVLFYGGKTASLKVVGIYKNSDVTGDIATDTAVLEKAGVPQRVTALSINVAPGADKAAVKKGIKDALSSIPIASVQDKQEFSDSIRGQINQLLYLIYGLLALAVVIAVIGIINTLGLSVIERTREVGLLRAIGMSRRKLRLMVTLESVAIAVLGAVLGLGLGLVFGSLLRYTLRANITAAAVPVGRLLVFLVIAVIVGVLAAVIPAIRASRLNVLQAIQSE